MIIRALVINEKLEGRKNHLDKLALFVRSGPCLKLPRRSVEKRPLTRHLFLVSSTYLEIIWLLWTKEQFGANFSVTISIFQVFRFPYYHGTRTRGYR